MMTLSQKIRLKELQLNAKKANFAAKLYGVKENINKELASPAVLLIAGTLGFYFGYSHFNGKGETSPSKNLYSTLMNTLNLGIISLSLYDKFKQLETTKTPPSV